MIAKRQLNYDYIFDIDREEKKGTSGHNPDIILTEAGQKGDNMQI